MVGHWQAGRVVGQAGVGRWGESVVVAGGQVSIRRRCREQEVVAAEKEAGSRHKREAGSGVWQEGMAGRHRQAGLQEGEQKGGIVVEAGQ